MTLIKKIAINSRNADTSALLSLILAALAKSDWSTNTFLTSVIGKVTEYNTSLTEAINRLKTYSQIGEKDLVRDLQIRSLFKLVEGYTHIPVAEIKEAALVVYNVLVQYGLEIQHEDNAAETAEVNSMLNDLSKPEVAAAIAKLQGVAEIVAALTAAEKDFETIALQQAEGEGAKKDLATASKLKKAAIKEVNDNLVGYMNTMAKVQPDTFLSTAQTIAELIENNNELVKRRRTKSDEEVEAEAI
ncbi:DUF6261 family protein [Marinifilum sp. D714]|uniref:DUF6261 family protein n=1 Tax=Marinifilum sp. D714 TaxID=2937523 RepID=UPI0027CE91A9|nr:DUF6261 family protein [Marinifilum sp. D714]MDQ2180848.1 DUF6261 family protein [Marinifilum sp. D714]